MSRVVTYLFLSCFVFTLASGSLWAAGIRRPVSHNAISQKVSLLGSPQIMTVAGNGSGGYSGDGAAATAAQLSYPWAVATDADGNLYIADSQNYSVRVVNRQNIAITVAGVTIQPGNIATIAGNGTPGFSGDNGPATSAQMGWLGGVAVASDGTVYVSDPEYEVVRKISTSGTISTYAGTFENYAGCDYYNNTQDVGDGGPATSATLTCPYGLAVDSTGNLYIADYEGGRVRKVDTQGTITTVAGSGNANDYYCDSSASGDGGSATAAVLSCPIDVKLDTNGNIYIADYYSYTVRVVNTQASAITVAGVTIQPGNIDRVAGSGSSGYSGDGGAATDAAIGDIYGLALDSQGNIYLSDFTQSAIRKVDTSGIITTFAGGNGIGYSGDGGDATEAQIGYPVGLAFDGQDNLFVAQYIYPAIREITGNGGKQSADLGSTTVGQNNTQSVRLFINQDVTISNVQANGDFAVVETPNMVLPNARRMSAGEVQLPAKMPAGLAKLIKKSLERAQSMPVRAHTPPSGCVGTFTHGDICTVSVKFTPTKPGPRWFQLWAMDNQENTYTFGLTGTGVGPVAAVTPGIINTPNGGVVNFEVTGIARDGFGNMYVTNYWQHAVWKIDTEGAQTLIAGETGVPGYDGDGGLATSAHLNEPMGLALDSVGNLYIADTLNNAIRKVDVNGIITTVAGDGDFGYTGDGSLATNAELANPLSVLADKQGNLYIGDSFNNVVRKVNLSRVITTIAGDGTGAGENGWNDGSSWIGSGYWGGDNGPATSAQLNMPVGLALDENGNLYIADTLNSAVRKVDSGGTITTVAGLCTEGCTSGYSGDGGPATEAQMVAPFGLAVDAAGDLYISDVNASSVRKVDVNGVITTVALGTQAPVVRSNAQNPFALAKSKKVKAHDVMDVGDGDLATQAQLYVPVFLAVDNSGSFYVTDVAMGRVRIVDATTSKMDFGAIDPHSTSDSQDRILYNAGNATLNFTQLSIAENFNWVENDTPCIETVEAGNSCVLTVNFTPPSGGNYSGSIVLTDDAFNTPQSISLTGVGTEPDYTITADPSSLTIRQGSTGTATLTVTPQYGYTGTIQFSCSGLPAYATCTFSPSSVSFENGGDPATVTLTVTTTGPTVRTSVSAPVLPNQTPGAPLNLWFVPAGLAGVVLFGSKSERRKRGLQRWLPVLFCVALMAGVMVLNGCGSSHHTQQHVTPTGTFSTTVTTSATASGNGGQHNAGISITIVPYNAQ
ncbi:MAG: hypothetical protein JST79_08890 [Acidobacteria bacterium]|nr:hypothetical protein [Acidobacteriota bacterium]